MAEETPLRTFGAAARPAQGDPATALAQPLDAVAVRILGALVEKQFTTPDVYPLTLNALVTACNQTSNRDPVMSLDEGTVAKSLEQLSKRVLVRPVMRGDSRVMRYRQELSQTLRLHESELAALHVLLLRGPQTAGEIRTRTARMVEFVDPRRVEVTLESLMAMDHPLVVQLPRRPGQMEPRYAHLLAGEPVDAHGDDDFGERSSSGADHAASRPSSDGEAARRTAMADRVETLEQEVVSLRAEVAELKAELAAFRRQFE